MSPERFDQIKNYEAAAIHEGVGDAMLSECVREIERLRAELDAADKVEGLEADLHSAILVAWKHGARDWVRMNYPELAQREEGEDGN